MWQKLMGQMTDQSMVEVVAMLPDREELRDELAEGVGAGVGKAEVVGADDQPVHGGGCGHVASQRGVVR